MQSNQWAPPPLPWCAAQGMGNSHSFYTQRSACWEQFRALNGKVRKFSKHFTAFTSVFEHCALLLWVQVPVYGVWSRSVTRTPHQLCRHWSGCSASCLCQVKDLLFLAVYPVQTPSVSIHLPKGALSDVQAGSELSVWGAARARRAELGATDQFHTLF